MLLFSNYGSDVKTIFIKVSKKGSALNIVLFIGFHGYPEIVNQGLFPKNYC